MEVLNKYKVADIKEGDKFYINDYGIIEISYFTKNGIYVNYSFLKDGKTMATYTSCATFALCELLNKSKAIKI